MNQVKEERIRFLEVLRWPAMSPVSTAHQVAAGSENEHEGGLRR
jgi:hypothetical protein